MPTLAQIPNFLESTAGNLPLGVERLGNLEVAPVAFEGQELFRVAAPIVRDRNQPGILIPAEVRAEQVRVNILRLIELGNDPLLNRPSTPSSTNYDPKTLHVYTARLQGEIIIWATDDFHSQPQRLVTVTNMDSDYYGLTTEELGQEWQGILYKVILHALEERLPEEFGNQITKAVPIFWEVIACSGFLWLLQRALTYRDTQLARWQLKEQPLQDVPVSLREIFINRLKAQFSYERRRKYVSFGQWFLGWMQAILWIFGISAIFNIFPVTRALSSQVLKIPVGLLIIWFSTGLISRLADVLIDRFSKVWEDYHLFTLEDLQRKSLRITTTISATKGFKTFLIDVSGIIIALSFLGVPTASILALGGVIAFAISFGFQNLAKDLMTGFLILWEDQYAIGDWIAIGKAEGMVENLNLRATQIRNAEGRLITVPNSSIIQVENLSRSWARVDFMVDVAYETDIDLALSVLKDVANQMYKDPLWQERIIEAPEVLGIERMDHAGMTLRVWIKTQPLQQAFVGREFRYRIRHALEANHIAIGIPQQIALMDTPQLTPEPIPKDAPHAI